MPRERINVDPALLGHRQEIRIYNEKAHVSYIGHVCKVFLLRPGKMFKCFAFSRDAARKSLNKLLLKAEVYAIKWRNAHDAEVEARMEAVRAEERKRKREKKKAANKKTQRKKSA